MHERADLASNFSQFDKCYAQYKVFLQAPDPLLLWSTYVVFMDLLHIGRDIAMSFAGFTSNFCAIVLGSVHP
jgi:hypothetical protein